MTVTGHRPYAERGDFSLKGRKVIEPLLLSVTRITTMRGAATLSNATAFFFERDERLFLVTARHALIVEPSNHHPDHLRIELHMDCDNLANTFLQDVPLFDQNRPVWRTATDSAGPVDVVAIELNRLSMPPTMAIRAYGAKHLVSDLEQIEIGTPVLIVGFPLGFYDQLYRLPIARQAIIASAFGVRFQGNGYFLTDAQMHRGSSGAPVVARLCTHASGRNDLAWKLLGIHTMRMDMSNRDISQDGFLNLNCAWYADVLNSLTN
jgi:hypothetical protein